LRLVFWAVNILWHVVIDISKLQLRTCNFVFAIHIDSHTSEYCFSPLFIVSSIVSENIVSQIGMQDIKAINCTFRYTSIPVLKYTANWPTLTCIWWVFSSNLDRKLGNLTGCSSYFDLVSFSKCHGNTIIQATTTSSHILDAYHSSVNLIIDFVCSIRCREFCQTNIKNNPDFNKYFPSYQM